MEEIKSVSLIGLGAVGSYLASNLFNVLGQNLKIVADGARAERLKKDGIIVNGKKLMLNVVPPYEKSVSDMAIIITKFSELKSAFEDIKNHVGNETVVMTPLNGIESEDLAKDFFGAEKVIYSLTRVSSVKKGNEIVFDNSVALMEIGEAKNSKNSPRIHAVKKLFDKANINTIIQDDMILAIWKKFICNVSENQVSAVLSLNYGFLSENDHANHLREMAAKEVIEIAKRKGIEIDFDYAVNERKWIKQIPYESKVSTLQDLECGRKTEVDILGGKVIQLGKEVGVPTPVNEFLFHSIKVLEDKF